MIQYPDINPVAFHLLGWPVHWYGLMYMAAFLLAFALARRFLRSPAFADLRPLSADDLMTAAIVGVLAGGRLGYVLFYDLEAYVARPEQVLYLWRGGMSFHGGLLGVIVALWLCARRRGVSFWRTADLAAVLAPVGLGLGRLGNFINGELPGRIAPPDLPWSMIFPSLGDAARHPSSLYQAFLEGGLLAMMMWMLASRRRPPAFLASSFLIGYALCRLFSEQFRQPDAHLGLLAGNMSMGQWLSLPMLLLGLMLMFRHRWLPPACRLLENLRGGGEKEEKEEEEKEEESEEPPQLQPEPQPQPQPQPRKATSKAARKPSPILSFFRALAGHENQGGKTSVQESRSAKPPRPPRKHKKRKRR